MKPKPDKEKQQLVRDLTNLKRKLAELESAKPLRIELRGEVG